MRKKTTKEAWIQYIAGVITFIFRSWLVMLFLGVLWHEAKMGMPLGFTPVVIIMLIIGHIGAEFNSSLDFHLFDIKKGRN